MDEHTTPVILCGGSGTRLWPLSRKQTPKQFATLFHGSSLFQETAQRAVRATGQDPVVVASLEHRFTVEQQLEEVGITPRAIICEPIARNTAPAVAAAAVYLHVVDPESPMLVLPSDHLIPDLEVFATEVDEAAAAARAGSLVTFGITPTTPHTGYGYLRQGALLSGLGRVATVEAFVEKPDPATAQEYLTDPKWLWNSGMFVLPPRTLIAELAEHAPEVLSAAVAAVGHAARQGHHLLTLDQSRFESSPDISLDYAVMERTDRAAVLPTQLRWSDVGAWLSLWEISEKDTRGNVQLGDVLADEVSNCYLHSEGPLVAAIGVSDLTVVATKDAVLVTDSAHSEGVKGLVQQLKAAAREEAETSRLVRRPWGTYECLDRGPLHQVKRIEVRPGGRLSLQRHRHRSEHWVVVAGQALATKGEETYLLGENDAIFIPVGCAHRLENPGEAPLHLIEVQVGSYLGEDDIERLEDAYGRC